MVGNNFNDIIAAKMYKNDNGTIRPMACNIRILIWGGQTPCIPYTLNNSGFPITNQATYNYAGMADDPYNPNVTLDWDNPLKLFYLYPNQSYSNNNLFNRGYSKLIQELTDPDSKIVKCWLYLNARDIMKLSFRNIIYIDNTYYFLNQIISYNPNDRKSTQVELLKLKRGVTFAPLSQPFVGEPINMDMLGNINPNPNMGQVIGQGNVNMGDNVLVVGNNIVIGGGN
jgi:hypothetical protein